MGLFEKFEVSKVSNILDFCQQKRTFQLVLESRSYFIKYFILIKITYDVHKCIRYALYMFVNIKLFFKTILNVFNN